jgi:hypothetical protein
MISPLSAGFSVLTHGIDGRLRRRSAVLQSDEDLAREDREFSLAVLRQIQAHPQATLSQLERAFEADSYRTAILPSILAEAEYEGLIAPGSPTSVDPAWTLTRQGEARLSQAEKASST